MAAYFLFRAGGGPMEHVKLMKLMYLADRDSLDKYWLPISYDEYYSMVKGPVLSMTLNLMSDNCDAESQGEWGKWISDKEDFRVSLRHKMTAPGDLDELVGEEISIMENVFDRFGHQGTRALVDHTHTLKEWTEPPAGGRLPIDLRSIFEALGKPADEIESKLRCLASAKPNTAFPLPVAASSLVSRLREFRPPPPLHPNAYADTIDAILSAQ
jgi:uncharacterized phage-associated protein